MTTMINTAELLDEAEKMLRTLENHKTGAAYHPYFHIMALTTLAIAQELYDSNREARLERERQEYLDKSL